MKTSSRRIEVLRLAMLLLALALVACRSLPTQTSTHTSADMALLQGQWDCQGPGGPCSVSISGDVLRFRARSDFWLDTTFTIPAGFEPKQLHATITAGSSREMQHVGRMVVALYRFESEDRLTLAVVDDFDVPPDEPVGDWEWVVDVYDLERSGASPSE